MRGQLLVADRLVKMWIAASALVTVSACTQSGPSHGPAPSTPPGSRTAASGTPAGTPTSALVLKPARHGHRTLLTVPLTRGTLQLPSFTPRSATIYVSWVCRGPGTFSLGRLFDFSPCAGRTATSTIHLEPRIVQRLTVRAEQGTSWRLLIQDSL